MARFVMTATLKMEVFPGKLSMKEKLGALLGHSCGWVPQEVLDRVPEVALGWVLTVGTEGKPGSLFEARSCSLGATWECPPLGSPPSQTQNHRKCLAAAKSIYGSNVLCFAMPPSTRSSIPLTSLNGLYILLKYFFSFLRLCSVAFIPLRNSSGKICKNAPILSGNATKWPCKPTLLQRAVDQRVG